MNASIPMNGEFLLDTNTVIRLFAHDRGVERKFDANPNVYLPIFVLGELYYGAEKSAQTEDNHRKIEDFLSRVDVLCGDNGTAREFGKIKNELQRKGRMIPENDLWIAALARETELTLVSDDKHFLARISHNTGEMDDRVPLLACPAVHGKLRENTAGQASSGTLR